MIKADLENIFGSMNVIDDPVVLDLYSKDHSLVSPRRPTCVVIVEDPLQIQKLMVVANKEKIPIIPRSSKESFYGLTVPNEGGVVADLSNMKQIFEIDPRNRRARIQPGVTYGELQQELEKYELMALNPLLPHHSKSVLSSHLERDPMLIPKFEYGDPLLILEAVLPNGDIFRTGSTLTSYSPDDQVSDLKGPWGPGLDFYRLFEGAQGTLGIVTWVSIKVEYLPQRQKMFFLCFNHITDMVEPAYEIQRQMLGNECFILNKINFANLVSQSWPEDFDKIMKALPPWILVLCISGMRRRPEERIEYEEEALNAILDKHSIRVSNSIAGMEGKERKIEERLRKPWPKNMEYWKLRMKGSFQDITFHTTLDKLPKIHDLIISELESNNFNVDALGCYFQPIERGRVYFCEYSLFYAPDDTKLSDSIKSFYLPLNELLLQNGALISRPYGDLAKIVYKHTGYYLETLRKIKTIFDPNNIMNPGKLCL